MQIIYSTNTNFALDFERRRLVDLAVKFGLGDERVLRQSERVDRLVNEHMKGQVK